MRKITPEKILRHLGLQAIRIISRLLFLKRGGYRGALGSYISPAAQSAANDLLLHDLLVPIMDLMTTQEIDKSLTRLGSEFDGGYIMIDQDYSDSFLISAGISNNNDFEMSFAALGGHCHQVDYTVNEAPNKHQNLTFEASRIVGEAKKERDYDVTLDELFEKYIQGSRFENSKNILKMDIEGSEWEILDSASNLHRFDQILIEIHYLERLAKEDYRELYLSGLSKLFEHYFPIAIAGNNCCGFVTIGGFSVPRVMEMTLVKRGDHKVSSKTVEKPTSDLITRNYRNRAPVVLKHW